MRDSRIAARPARRYLHLALLLIAALAIVALAQRWLPDSRPAPDAAAAPMRTAWGPETYAAALDKFDRDIALHSERVAADPKSWMRQESLAMVLHARGQLAGSHEDLTAAYAAADAARAAAPDASGPVLARAIVAMSLHRNAVAAQELRRMAGFVVPAEIGDRAEASAILGDVALYHGDYAAALRQYREADELAQGPGTLIRRSEWHRHRGDFATARTLIEQSLAQQGGTSPWQRAAFLLQLGALDLQTGKWDAAEARFREADRNFAGWWLAQAHIAQLEAARGDFAAAERRYRFAMRGAERPSVMDALAAVYRAQGKAEAAERLNARAGALWTRRAAQFPEAYADHAFEAAVRAGDAARAHRLAAINYRARPYGDARIGLARAAEGLGRLASARAVLEELDRTGWRSAEQYRVLTEVCERLGDARCARSARAKALAITPRAFDPRAKLLAFGNH